MNNLLTMCKLIRQNGYVHSTVKPAMENLTVIDMNDKDAIQELMNSRK